MSLWTDERVDETVTSAYVHSHLRPNEQELLQRQLYFGGDLTDDTYLDWILTRAKRFFLILVATGVPDQIFGVIDDSYDDEDLPVIEEAVPDLRLSYEPDRALDKRFYKNQFKFLTRIVGEGEHIRYADEETVPVVPLNLKSVVLSLAHDGVDRVRLPTANQKIFVRRRIKLEAPLTEDEMLNEIAASRRLCHEHIVSIFGSYLYQGSFNVLSLPAPEWSLKAFLTDSPKSFAALAKQQRRRILINWPHCLSNALAWLHSNDEFHGAIRPSNIQIDESFRISLGLLDGEGLLRDKAKPDDIEAYQYGPPERWKRAVTIQSTGSAAVALPSGGRSGRRADGNGRLNTTDSNNPARSRSASSAATYTFQPTSRGDYARLRLSSALPSDTPPQPIARGRDVLSPTDNKSISSSGTTRRVFDPSVPGRAPSILSSTSSNGKKSGPPVKSPMFVSAPEGRSAVVQTWQSVEQDMFASDIFSLGAVSLDILTLLCKRSYSSFQRHRSSKNRMAGRGGGLADASFHANLGQVFLWAQSLQKDAEKKAKKDEGQVYHAVGPVVQLTLQCLERDPAARLSSEQLERKIGEHIQRFAGLERLHCVGEHRQESNRKDVNIPIRDKNVSHRELTRHRSDDPRRQPPQDLYTEHPEPQPQQQRFLHDGPIVQSPTLHTSPSVSTTPATTSVSSLLSFNFDGLSDTVVAESPRSREQSMRRTGTRGELTTPEHHQIPWSNEQDTPRQKYWNNWHNNDSQVDPRLSFGESVDTGAFTYLNYSTSASSDEGFKHFPRPPAEQPPKPPPNRRLPPVPPIPMKVQSERHINAVPPFPVKVQSAKPNQRVPRMKTSNNDVAVLNHISQAALGGRPLRVDSLPKTLEFDAADDYHETIRQTRRLHTAKSSSRSRSQQDQYLLHHVDDKRERRLEL
ncbi:serine/threonine protein kinase [Cladophialophora yegresii CBS 114405]|uniref:Serine/threonine protein kinase n=1 Tax=Cladophialophora yegresii CBS 114405 TaxID=1182544 RepID=W9VYQ7_9EURO|nr:serine/threonine protein kinase [Cladophialophora yegresii CBS 114405]EXJ57371.1 serine/threonine protein kinase [Cladophialophora yegresii CBS 114405]